jgi:hypothetical protein
VGAGLNTSTGGSTDPGTATSSDPNTANGNNNAGSSTSAFGQSGQTFGGAGIMGFSPNSSKQSILVYKKKTHYNEWEFVYDPKTDLMQAQAAMQGGVQTGGSAGFNQPTTQTTPPPTTTTP